MRYRVYALRFCGLLFAGLTICLGLILAPVPVRANDGFYELASGVLRLSNAENISILREDLKISFERVTVSYQIKNLAGRAQQAIIGFPLPHPISLDQESDGPGPEGLNEMLASFRITVDGEPKVPEGTGISIVLFPPIQDADTDFDSFTSSTLDISDLLIDAGLELDPENVDLSRLEDEQFAAMIRASLPEAYRDYFPGWWEVRQIPYWTQDFAAGETLTITHSYTPFPGGMISSGYEVESGGVLKPREGQIAEEVENALYEIERLRNNWRAGNAEAEVFCSIPESELSDMVERGLDDLLQSQIAAGIISPTNGDYLTTIYSFLTYVLSTANSWSGPIGEFHLTIDGGGQPAIFCLNGKIELTDPDRFIYESTVYDFRPVTDLEIVRPF